MSEYIVNAKSLVCCARTPNEVRQSIVQPIVRCRDCKYCFAETRHGLLFNEPYTVNICDCKQWSTSSLMPPHTVEPDGFCYWGEKK